MIIFDTTAFLPHDIAYPYIDEELQIVDEHGNVLTDIQSRKYEDPFG